MSIKIWLSRGQDRTGGCVCYEQHKIYNNIVCDYFLKWSLGAQAQLGRHSQKMKV